MHYFNFLYKCKFYDSITVNNFFYIIKKIYDNIYNDDNT
jgi:hypothetical protein